MICADLHMHTLYSHGKNTPFEMHAEAEKKGLSLIGFTEHSPRPPSYNYTHEYRDRLTRHFPDYIAEVSKLRESNAYQGPCRVLLGLEMDWLPADEAFVRKACTAYDYDYLIGSVHFLGDWGFDDLEDPWQNASSAQIFSWYEEYFNIWLSMLESGLFQIAAHPDLIKIYSVRHFHKWLEQKASKALIYKCLSVLKDRGMAMEISSAGLRKACAEIYPCPEIMAMAAELNLNISLASDAHNIQDIASFFPELALYAKKYGFDRQAIYKQGELSFMLF